MQSVLNIEIHRSMVLNAQSVHNYSTRNPPADWPELLEGLRGTALTGACSALCELRVPQLEDGVAPD